ncbi:MAG: hypothetical protein QM656_05030 [Paracoccaceae bacterium]
MTFKEYLTRRQTRDNIQGDFVRDAKSDLTMPDVTTWAELKRHLLRRNACDGALEAVELVWSAYQARLRRI